MHAPAKFGKSEKRGGVAGDFFTKVDLSSLTKGLFPPPRSVLSLEGSPQCRPGGITLAPRLAVKRPLSRLPQTAVGGCRFGWRTPELTPSDRPKPVAPLLRRLRFPTQ